MLSTPQMSDAVMAMAGVPSTARVSQVKSSCMAYCTPISFSLASISRWER